MRLSLRPFTARAHYVSQSLGGAHCVSQSLSGALCVSQSLGGRLCVSQSLGGAHCGSQSLGGDLCVSRSVGPSASFSRSVETHYVSKSLGGALSASISRSVGPSTSVSHRQAKVKGVCHHLKRWLDSFQLLVLKFQKAGTCMDFNDSFNVSVSQWPHCGDDDA